MKHAHRITFFHNDPSESGIGRITAAARIDDSVGTSGTTMRTLGCYALVYVFSGKCEYYDRQQARRIRKGDLILLFPGEIHAYGPKENDLWNELYLLFDGKVFDLWRKQGLIAPARPVMNLQPVDVWKARFMEIAEKSITPLQRICRLQSFLADAQENDRYQIAEESDRQWLAEANVLLAHDPADSETVRRTAATLGLSYETFRKKYNGLRMFLPGSSAPPKSSKKLRSALRKPTCRSVPSPKSSASATNFTFRAASRNSPASRPAPIAVISRKVVPGSKVWKATALRHRNFSKHWKLP